MLIAPKAHLHPAEFELLCTRILHVLSVCLFVRSWTFAMLFEALDGSWSSLPGAPYSGFGGTLDSLERFCTRI